MKKIKLFVSVLSLLVLVSCNHKKNVSAELKATLEGLRSNVELLQGTVQSAESKLSEVQNAEYENDSVKNSTIQYAEQALLDAKTQLETAQSNYQTELNNAGVTEKDVFGSSILGGVTGLLQDGADVVKDGANAVKDGASELGSTVLEGADAIYGAGADLVGKTVKGFEYLGEFTSRKLKDGTELVVPNKGFEYKLVDFIEGDDEVSKDNWFDLRRIVFTTGSTNLDEHSMAQIENVAKILKAYPNVHLKIGGYTDNTGNADNNKKLSAKRAEAVVNALVEKGIDASRLSSEGYGSEHPIASNDTPEGRELNRRVAGRVTQK